MTAILEVRGLNKHYGGLHVTRDITLTLRAGERVGLIGPNGAGKTTFVNQLTGVVTPSSGTIFLEGHNLMRAKPHERVRRGLVRTFQITQLAATLPVQRQVELAIHEREGSVQNQWRAIGSFQAVQAEARAILKRLNLDQVAGERPTELAYGQQRMIEIALAMALRPKVLLLDEPMAGVPDGERETVLRALDSLPPSLALIMIEHDMDLIFRFAHRIVVLADGAMLADGPPEEIRVHPAVRTAYLGSVTE